MVYLAPTKTPETMSEPRLGVLVLGWLLVFASAGPWLAASDTVDRGPGTTVAVSAPDGPAVDNTVTRVSVRASGNATWTVEIRTRLGSEREVEQYRAFQAHFRNNTSHYLGTYRERIRSVVGDAERVTGREMRAVNFSASTDVQEVPRRWGVITYRFRWTSFAAAPNATTLTVGDAFEGGYYLDEDDIFAIEAPDGYAIESVSPVPDESQSGVVRWSGPRDFADERPHAVLRIVESDATTSAGLDATTAQGETAAGRDAAGGTDRISGELLVAVALVAVGVGAGAVWRFRSDEVPSSSGDGDASVAPPSHGDSATVRTDDEEVEALLQERGGRMKQAEVAEVLDWSASKTSRVLSDLEDDGIVERVRLGRENVVDLSDAADE
jgi:hypothetical protein